jgi:hypothetical protein
LCLVFIVTQLNTMKRTTLTVGIILSIVSTAAFAQAPSNLKGPEAKNYKPWEDTNRTNTQILVATDDNQLKGPEAKNKKVWLTDANTSKKVVKTNGNRVKPKGPKAKNAKPWKNN